MGLSDDHEENRRHFILTGQPVNWSNAMSKANTMHYSQPKQKEVKPWKAFGMCPLSTDGNGNIERITQSQCMIRLRKYMSKQHPNLRCKNLFVVDCGDYWKWSAC